MTIGLSPLEALAGVNLRGSLRGVGIAVASVLMLASVSLPASAQAPAASPMGGLGMASSKADPNAKMLVTADQLVYDYKNDTVSAVGNVQMYYDGSSVEAKKVTFNRKTNRVLAEGNVRLKQKDGKIVTADNLELSQDLKEGFINSLRLDTPDKTHFAATRADRTEGNVTVFQNGVYTACEPCKDKPEKPPLWQVKATRIIHNEDEKMIYYKDATFEFFGMPIAYFPYFSSPDPTVKRKTGFLFPEFYSGSNIGYGASVPFFWNIAPDRDITLDPMFFNEQGVLMRGEWRQRLDNGSYSIRAAGIDQQDKEAFYNSGAPLPGYRDQRGLVETHGQFAINDYWTFGWDGSLVSDRTFLRDYGFVTSDITERNSQIYLTGQGDRSYFDLRGMYFLGLSVTDDQNRLPVVGTLDYSYVWGKPVFGGEAGINVNFTTMTRDQADFIGMSSTTASGGGIGIPAGSCALSNPNPTQCLLRGAPGDYTRLSAEAYWKRTITDNLGQQWTPFAQVRVDVAQANISALPSSYTDGPTTSGQNVLQSGNESLIRAMPAVGLDYKYPFISVENWGTQTLTPRVQFIARPNETSIGKFPNEDAQSLVFDDTTLFAIDKYSGYDRVEGGGRLNVGFTYTASMKSAGVITATVGQSYHLFGVNSFAEGDMANTGLNSGLDTNVSDYVASFAYSPTDHLEFISRYRFAEDNGSLQRLELEGRTSIDKWSFSAIYGRYAPQPELGYYDNREGVFTTASYKFNENWSVSGAVRYNLVDSGFDYTQIGVNYMDDCFTLAVNYISDYSLNGPGGSPSNSVMLRIGLRTLGETGIKTSLGSSTSSAN
ncbi:LPS-assembly protein LptD [Azorhizobium oxalatiphilum]|uniref:LPS-assembly protein LptD n=1 Tax=Azorhizobium oxalatiphilum TaxID=980631 RepID=A0A917CGN3_9HYPH|nr:LPS-assembly protein LptD [Azorhizobium oxalatiphilum]GGF87020.1 LPS-assembly protein LptD [Azorhizobium oxalatiphilum]